MFATTDSAPKLVQLRETESLGIFNQHYGCIWHIDAYLEHSGADQRVGVTAPKPIHDLLLFRRRNPAMKQLASERMQAFQEKSHKLSYSAAAAFTSNLSLSSING